MNVSLTSELEGMIRKLVKSGRYSSASEVVRDGLRLVEDREKLREVKLQELRKAIREGIESGPSTPFVAGDVAKRGKERRRSSKSSK